MQDLYALIKEQVSKTLFLINHDKLSFCTEDQSVLMHMMQEHVSCIESVSNSIAKSIETAFMINLYNFLNTRFEHIGGLSSISESISISDVIETSKKDINDIIIENERNGIDNEFPKKISNALNEKPLLEIPKSHPDLFL